MTFDPSFTSASFTPDRLHAGDYPIATIQGTVTDDQAVGALVRGTVMAQHVDGSWACVHEGGDHTADKARGILAKAADPSGGDVAAIIYVSGEFNEDRVTLGGAVVLADVRDVLRNVNVYLRNPVSA